MQPALARSLRLVAEGGREATLLVRRGNGQFALARIDARVATAARLAVIGVMMLIVAVAFAAVGGWLSPHRLTQDRMMQAFMEISGAHPGFRHNHAKGLCVSGWFDSSGAVASLSEAEVLQAGGRAQVIGRFALAGGMPSQADTPAQVTPWSPANTTTRGR